VGSWVIWLSPSGSQGTFSFNVFGWHIAIPFLLIKLLFGNCAPGAIALVFALLEGKQQLQQILSSLLRWRAPFRYYLFSCALPLSVFYASLALTRLYFPWPRLVLSPTRFLLELAFTLPFGPLWEELAWRAYTLRKLQVHYSQLTSALILGLYWGAWHIPLWELTLGLSRTTGVQVWGAGMITILSLSIIFTSLFNRTGHSLPVVILLHGVYASASHNMFVNVRTGQIECLGLSALLFTCIAVGFGAGMRRQLA